MRLSHGHAQRRIVEYSAKLHREAESEFGQSELYIGVAESEFGQIELCS